MTVIDELERRRESWRSWVVWWFFLLLLAAVVFGIRYLLSVSDRDVAIFLVLALGYELDAIRRTLNRIEDLLRRAKPA